jgi:hypothetical protein
VELTQAHEPGVLGTLAAAYAEAGELPKAVQTEEQAGEGARQQGNARLAGTLDARLTTLQAGSPIRDR